MNKPGINSMFGLEGDKTWVFTGGDTVSGNPQKIAGARTFVAHYEEYIRWTIACQEGELPRQRYIMNAGQTGVSIQDTNAAFDERIRPLSPAAVSYLVGKEDEPFSCNPQQFQLQLELFIDKCLSLRYGNGLSVIQLPHAVNDPNTSHNMSKLADTVRRTIEALPQNKRERVTLADHFSLTDTPQFHRFCLNADDSLNARGHLELARQLALATVGSDHGRPFHNIPSLESSGLPWDFLPPCAEITDPARKHLKERLADRQQKMVWLLAGDSITHGAQHTGLYDSMAQHIEKFVKYDCSRHDDLVINTAVSGATTSITLAHVSDRIERYSADVVAIMLGTNDAHCDKTAEEGGSGKGLTSSAYRRELQQLIDIILQKNKAAVLLLLTPLPNTDSARTDITEFARIVRELAVSSSECDRIILVDQYEQWNRIIQKRPAIQQAFADGIHPNAVGQLLMTKILLLESGIYHYEGHIASLEYPLADESSDAQLEIRTFLTGGKGGYGGYRIPGLVVTKKDTLIAYCEARMEASDWGVIDILIRRSTDHGITWSEGYVLASGLTNGKTMNNPVIIVDSDGLTLHLLYCDMYGVAAIGGSVFYRKSLDDGITWSEPKDISSSCHPADGQRNVFAIGPGHGIHLKNGILLAPVWMTEVPPSESRDHSPSVVSTIFSTDGGENWKLGDIIHQNEGGIELPNPNETTAIELSDGRVMLNIRNCSLKRKRAVSYSTTGWSEWSTPVFDEALSDPGCFGSLIRYDEDTILFSHANVMDSPRRNISVRASRDNGITWIACRSLEPGNPSSDYSDLAVDSQKMIYCLYEYDNCHSLKIARFKLEWLLQGTESCI